MAVILPLVVTAITSAPAGRTTHSPALIDTDLSVVVPKGVAIVFVLWCCSCGCCRRSGGSCRLIVCDYAATFKTVGDNHI